MSERIADKVSVVMPAYNAADTIAEALESVLAQTHRHWEVIVVDDGSTDRTAAVASQFVERDPRFRLVRQENRGEAGARNAGLAAASGDWLLFLDADDWIAPVHLERMTDVLRANSALDAVHCLSARVAPDGSLVPESYEPPEGDMFAVLARRAAFPVHACIVKRSLVGTLGGFDESLQRSPDWDLWQRIARTGAQFGAVREVLAFYRMRHNSVSLDAYPLLKDGLRILKQGHGPDVRVPNPHPAHAQGLAADGYRKEAFYLLSWCAGLVLGAGGDARPLLCMIRDERNPELYADAVAQCLFGAAALPACTHPSSWEALWHRVKDNAQRYLAALEEQSTAEGLAHKALAELKRLILRNSSEWGSTLAEYDRRCDEQQSRIEQAEAARRDWDQERFNWQARVEDYERALTEKQALAEHWELKRQERDEEVGKWKGLAEDRERSAAELRARVEQLALQSARLEAELPAMQQLAHEREQSIAEKQRLVEQLGENCRTLESELARWKQTAGSFEQSALSHQRDVERLTASQRALEQSLAEGQTLAGSLRETVANYQKLAEQWDRQRQEFEDAIAQLNRDAVDRERLEARASELRQRFEDVRAERDRLLQSVEHRTGDLLLNRMRLRRPLEGASAFSAATQRQWSLARSRAERRLGRSRTSLRVMATACSDFPIYSQTFVYQELCQLVRQGISLRFVYSNLDDRDKLQSQFSVLWKLKRRMLVNRVTHQRDFARYRRRMPDRVESLLDKLGQASGLSREALVSHDNVLQAFTYTRMAEALRPHYLHSYFFYDRSLMSLVAAYLLQIPRGISCYADHMLNDYELKVVPLHMELCDVVVATSERIKQELLAIAPHVASDRILVKPNGIDPEQFPVVERPEPAGGSPHRIVTVCRIEPKKGLLDLVEAVGMLRQRGLNVEAHVVGDVDEWSDASREYKQRLDQRITELGLWGTVHLEGRQNLDEIRRFLGISQLFVAPFVETEAGDKDGVPTALLEGMATGLPAVATDAGSISEVVDDGTDGVVVPQRDAAPLADAIESLLVDGERRRRLGARAAEKVRLQFDANVREHEFHERVRACVNGRV